MGVYMRPGRCLRKLNQRLSWLYSHFVRTLLRFSTAVLNPSHRLCGLHAWTDLSRCTNGERAATWLRAFHDNRVVFVHIPRCAGTSVETACFGLDLYSQHYTLPQLEAMLGLSDDAASDRYFRFTIVRDPLERFLSAFAYLLDRRPSNGEPISEHDLIASELLRGNAEWRDGPLAFLRHIASLPSWECVPLHFRPQLYFLGGESALRRFDRIARFESLLADMASVASMLDLGSGTSSCVELPHKRTARSAARKHWRSDELAALVRRVYARDYRAFGYE